MKTKRIILLLSVFFVLVLTLASCDIIFNSDQHEHTWREATCTAPKTCTICGATEGEKLPPPDIGDVDLDGKIDKQDVLRVVEFLSGNSELNTTEKMVADINEDSIIDMVDALLLCGMIAEK